VSTDREVAGADSVRILAPAKVNLGLRIIGVRNDGYHCLESVLVPIDWADELSVELLPGGAREIDFDFSFAADAVETDSAQVPDGEENLVHRAARGFCEAAGRPLSIRVRLTKRLPAAAGLGGGSSDAGAVLRALDRLRPGWVSPKEQHRLALSLGADVPFFLHPQPALVTGIGDEILPLSDFPDFHLLLANPGDALSTADVFAAWDLRPPSLTPARSGSILRALSAFLDANAELDGDRLANLLVNDLAESAESLCPSMSQLMGRVWESGARAVGMSGSGATVFGVFDSAEQARRAHKQLTLGEQGWSRLAATLSPR